LLDYRCNGLRSAAPRGGFQSLGGCLWILACALGAWLPSPASAQAGAARVQITAPPDAVRLTRLSGSTRPEATATNDRGLVPDTLALEHMQLLLKRPAEREAALRKAIEDLHDRTSPQFHRWLTVAQIRERYGLAQADLDAISGWLKAQGFTVNGVYPSTMLIDFSGTAGEVRAAFHTEIHALEVAGQRHFANMSDPLIPTALAAAITGVVSLHDFRPHANYRARAMPLKSAYTTGATGLLVAPADLATIYNLNPLFADGISGQGQSIVVIEDTDVYNYSAGSGSPDWTTFRQTFGLSAYTQGSFTQMHPAGASTCSDPGVVDGDEFEAELDAEWASAAAPSAAIVLASCANAATTGIQIALENLVNASSPPAIISISYGECEASNGAAANAAFFELYQQAVTEGISVYVAAGDEGAASCDADLATATHGVGVNALASTPYNVAVGGTDFGDTYAGTTSAYWSTGNSSSYGSALSYVPEIPWNDSCAGTLLATREGASPSYGSNGFCNKSPGNTTYKTTASGSGGPSGCATGSPPKSGVVGGTCIGYTKPSWQSLAPGNPSDGVRDLPDVSLFAANGIWGHYYVLCDSDTGDTKIPGHVCTGAPSGWSGGGGTSFAAPILAGVQALVNQSAGAKQGNPNPSYYALAAAAFGSGGNSGCNSSAGVAASAGCVFYDVTLGDIDVDCTGTNNCFLPSGTIGVLSTNDSSFGLAFGTAPGWDFATGIGTINAENLVNGWNASNLTLSGAGTVTSAGQLSYAWTIGNTGPRTAVNVVLSTTLPSGYSLVSASSSSGCTAAGQVVSCAISSLGIGDTTPLNIVIEPSGTQPVNLTFTLTASNGVLFPANDSIATSLTPPAGDGGSDGPLPLWADIALGGLLLGAARRAAPVRRRLSG
jgi:uncharacterized repeat protein (TIGR01451 family)